MPKHPPTAGSTITLSGIARPPGRERLIAAFSRVDIEDKHHEAKEARPFVLETDDGARVSITPPDSVARCLVPRVERSGPWETVELPLRGQHAPIAPGPGTRVRVTAAAMHDGDRVTVLGHVTKVGPGVGGGHSGYRSAPPVQVLAVKADVIGIGPDDVAREAATACQRALEPKGARAPRAHEAARSAAPQPRDSWPLAASLLIRALTIVPGLIIVLKTGRPGSGGAWLLALAWWAVGAMVVRPDPLRPSVARRLGAPLGLLAYVVGILALFAGVSTLLGLFTDPAKLVTRRIQPLTVIVPQAVFFLVALYRWRIARGFSRRLRPRPGWDVIEATATEDVGIYAKTANLSAADGPRILNLEDAFLGSERSYSVAQGAGRGREDDYYSDISAGSRLLVAGRFGTSKVLSVRGPGSLVVFAAMPGNDPRAALARKLLSATVTVLELGLLLAASVAIAYAP